jgi:hypothetical protein
MIAHCHAQAVIDKGNRNHDVFPGD